MDFLNKFFCTTQLLVTQWWPWLNIYNDLLLIQFFLVCTLLFIYLYKNVYYTLLYVFLNFFLLGVYLSIFQIELFAAFLWLIECSVLFVFLLLLFFLNVKGTYIYTNSSIYTYASAILFILFFILVNHYSENDNNYDMGFYGLIDNYYESLINPILNDLFGFSLSYYIINGVEFIIVGFLLLVGSVICVNLYQMNKNIRVQSYNSFLTVFNFFTDFSSFNFLRRQNLTKQGNTKASLKIFKKK